MTKKAWKTNTVQYRTKNQIRSTDDEPPDSYAMTFDRNERLSMSLIQSW
nr:hypothetical protein [Mammaliicoccus lentus]